MQSTPKKDRVDRATKKFKYFKAKKPNMGRFIDFMIKLPENITPKELGTLVLEHLIIGRIKVNKPCVIFLTGQSGEGKSYTGLKIQEIVDKAYHVNFADMMEAQTIFTPFQYGEKINRILHDKEYKKVRVIMIDEAREVVSGKQWYKFIVQAIPAINNLSRQIKPLVIIVISQSSRDIVSELKRSINYYVDVTRPIHEHAILRPYKLWTDDHNLEAIKQKKATIRGYIKHNGMWEHVRIRNIEVTLVDKAIRKKYDYLSKLYKSKIIKTKLDRFFKELSKEVYGDNNKKLNKIVEFYVSHPENLNYILKKRRKKIVIKKDIQSMHELTNDETRELEHLLTDRLTQLGYIIPHKEDDNHEEQESSIQE